MFSFIDGQFAGDEKNPCMCCTHYIKWGCRGGDCEIDESYVSSDYTCDNFERNTEVFDENNEFLSDEARDSWYA